MKSLLAAFAVALIFTSCFNPFHETIKGNGNISTSERDVSSFTNIRCAGSYDVELTQAESSSVKIETDEKAIFVGQQRGTRVAAKRARGRGDSMCHSPPRLCRD